MNESTLPGPRVHTSPVWLDRPLWRRITPAGLLVLALMLASALLHLYNLQAIGDSNAYYTAAVKSMLASWHNFFFVAAEPGGSVSVDKPPLGLWIQAGSAAVLGVSGFSVSLPNILAGILGIPLLYHLVRRPLGSLAGLLAAAVFCLTPTVIGTDRNTTMDGMLVFCLLLAAWAFLRAAERSSLRWLLVGAVLVGLGFNIKMLQAYLPLPAFFAVYFLGARLHWGRRLLHLGAAGLLLLAVSLSWALAVDLTPAEARPYVGSSTDNTVSELILGHNGLNRLFGRSGATPPAGQMPEAGLQGGQPPSASRPPQAAVQACAGLTAGEACTIRLPGGGTESGLCRSLPQVLVCAPSSAPGQPGGLPAGADAPRRAEFSPDAGSPFSGEIGSPSLVRLFTPPLGKEMSWLLPLGLAGLVVLAVASRPRLPLAPVHQALVLWGGWLLTCLVFFSVAEFFHDYYLIMLAPPLAAVAGGGLGQLWARRGERWSGWVLAAAVVVTLVFEVWLALQFGQDAWWLRLAAGLAVLGLLLLAAARRLPRLLLPAAQAVLVCSLLVVPLAWCVLTVAEQTPDVNLPGAYGGVQPEAPGMAPASLGRPAVDAQLLAYLQADTQDVEYLLAVPNAQSGSGLVLATGRPVLYMGGFTGSDPVVDAADLQSMVENRELRYVLYPADRSPQEGIAAWLQASCSVVPEFSRGVPGQGGQTLYRCTAGE